MPCVLDKMKEYAAEYVSIQSVIRGTPEELDLDYSRGIKESGEYAVGAKGGLRRARPRGRLRAYIDDEARLRGKVDGKRQRYARPLAFVLLDSGRRDRVADFFVGL
jgi:hypothetical protein